MTGCLGCLAKVDKTSLFLMENVTSLFLMENA
jgi:hypothetical protein